MFHLSCEFPTTCQGIIRSEQRHHFDIHIFTIFQLCVYLAILKNIISYDYECIIQLIISAIDYYITCKRF